MYLLSDGRTHDFPKDSEMAEVLRQKIPNLDIWSYGTGEYVAMSELLKITKVLYNEKKIFFFYYLFFLLKILRRN